MADHDDGAWPPYPWRETKPEAATLDRFAGQALVGLMIATKTFPTDVLGAGSVHAVRLATAAYAMADAMIAARRTREDGR